MELHANAFLSCPTAAKWLCDSSNPDTAPLEFLAAARALNVRACPPPPLGRDKTPRSKPAERIYVPVHICDLHGHVLGFARGAVLPARDDYTRAPSCTRFVIDGGRRAAMIFAHADDGTVSVAVDTYDEAGDAVSDVRYFAKCSKAFPDCLLACVKTLHKRDCFTCTKKAVPCLCNNRCRLDNIMAKKRRKFFIEPQVFYDGRVTVDRRPPWRQTFDSYVMSRIGSYVVQVQHTPVASANNNTVPPYSIAYRAVYRNMNESDTAGMVQAVLSAGVKPNIAARTKYIGMSTISVNDKNLVCQQTSACCTKDEYARFDCLLKIPWVQVREKNRMNGNNVNVKGIEWCAQACAEADQCGIGAADRFAQTLSVADDNGAPIMDMKYAGDYVNSLLGIQSEARNEVVKPLSVPGAKRKSCGNGNANDYDSGELNVRESKKPKCSRENGKLFNDDEIVPASASERNEIEKNRQCNGVDKSMCCPGGGNDNAEISKIVVSEKKGEEGGVMGSSLKNKSENNSLASANSKCGEIENLATSTVKSKQEKCYVANEQVYSKKCVEKAAVSTVVQKCDAKLPSTEIIEKQPSLKKCVENTTVEKKEEGFNDVTQNGCCPTVVIDIVDENEQGSSADTGKWNELKECVQQATTSCCKTSCDEPKSNDTKKPVTKATNLVIASENMCCPPKDHKNDTKQGSESSKRRRRATARRSQDISEQRRNGAKSNDTTKDSSHSSYSDIQTDSFCGGEDVECCPKVPVAEPDEWDLPSRAIRPSTPSDVLYSGSTRRNAPPSPCMCAPKDGPDIADSITGDVEIRDGDTVRESNRVGVLKWLTRETPIRLLPPIASTGMSSSKPDCVAARSVVR